MLSIEDVVKQLMGRHHSVYCHGCFSLLHLGHIRHLKEASRLGHRLIVSVTGDAWVNRQCPFTARERAEAVEALSCVDYVFINEHPTAVEAIQLLKPAIYCKGKDYESHPTQELLAEHDAIEAVGGKLFFTEVPPLTHSSELMRRILAGD